MHRGLFGSSHDEKFYEYYSGGGTGLRSLLEGYVFLRKFDGKLGFDYVLSEIEKLELSEFEEKNRTLALNLFVFRAIPKFEKEPKHFIPPLKFSPQGTEVYKIGL